MRRMQFLSSMILMTALAVPAASFAQDRDHDRDDHAKQMQRDRDHDRDAQGRIYDTYRRDYHAWDANEQRYYSQWAQQHRYQNREYAQLNARQQRDYWKWRHQHEKGRDHDNDRH